MLKNKKQTFSTANLSMSMFIISIFAVYLFLSRKNLTYMPKLSMILFLIIIISISWYVLIKYPLFISENNCEIEKENYEGVYVNEVNWIKCLYFGLFSAEKSRFISLFSGIRLKLYTKGRICKFIWEDKEVKLYHRVLDILFMFLFIFTGCCIASWLAAYGYKFGFVLTALTIFLLFRKQILSYSFSVNIGKKYNYNLNVIYPYVTSELKLFKYYGMAYPFNKTILITEDTFRLNPIIKEYVIAHEKGHLMDNKRTLLSYFIGIIFVIYVTIGPWIIIYNGIKMFVFMPLAIYVIYSITLGYYFRESSEIIADKYAVNLIGKEKCKEALNMIAKESVSSKNKFNLGRIFFRAVPMDWRIKLIDEYDENKI